VEKAEALLLKIRDALKEFDKGDKSKGDVQELVAEFYKTLPHKTEDGSNLFPTPSWLSKKQDLCQVNVIMLIKTRCVHFIPENSNQEQ
jgi:hypothetical protein